MPPVAGVLGETYAFLRHHVAQQAAMAWLDAVESARVSGHLRAVYADSDLDRAGREMLRRFADQALSYTDALTLVVLEVERVRFVFGFDRHLGLTGRTLLPGPRR